MTDPRNTDLFGYGCLHNTVLPTVPCAQARVPYGRSRVHESGIFMVVSDRAGPHAHRRRQRPRAHDPPRRRRRDRRRAVGLGALDRLVDPDPAHTLRAQLLVRRAAPAHEPPPRARELHRDRPHAGADRRGGRSQRWAALSRAAVDGAAGRDGGRALSPAGRGLRDRAHRPAGARRHARGRPRARRSRTPCR